MPTRRTGFDWPTVVARTLVVAFVVVLFSVVFGIRLAIAAGDVGCVFAQDPALCVAVKTVGDGS